MWHLPFIRAIAAVSPGGKVTFLAPPTSSARELLAAEPTVAEVLYFNQFGSELQRGINLIKLIALLRRNRFRALWILDRTIRPALAGFLAGIPERIGVGFTPQRWFITNKGIDQSHFHDFPIDWLVALMADMQVPLPTTEPNLRIAGDLLAAIGDKFSACPRPWIVLGLGGSHPDKDWPTSLLGRIPRRTARAHQRNGLPDRRSRPIARAANLDRGYGGSQRGQRLRSESGRVRSPPPPCRSVHRHGFRPVESRGGDGDRGLRPFRRNTRP